MYKAPFDHMQQRNIHRLDCKPCAQKHTKAVPVTQHVGYSWQHCLCLGSLNLDCGRSIDSKQHTATKVDDASLWYYLKNERVSIGQSWVVIVAGCAVAVVLAQLVGPGGLGRWAAAAAAAVTRCHHSATTLWSKRWWGLPWLAVHLTGSNGLQTARGMPAGQGSSSSSATTNLAGTSRLGWASVVSGVCVCVVLSAYDTRQNQRGCVHCHI